MKLLVVLFLEVPCGWTRLLSVSAKATGDEAEDADCFAAAVDVLSGSRAFRSSICA